MGESARDAQPFMRSSAMWKACAWRCCTPLRTPDRLNKPPSACASAWCRPQPPRCAHFEDNGISVGLVFRLRQLRERILRVRVLDLPAVRAARRHCWRSSWRIW